MIRKTKIGSIPDPTGNNATDVLRVIKDSLDVRERRSGDDLDGFVSFRDLKDLNLISEGTTTSSGGGSIPGGAIIPPGTQPPDYTPPPAPTGLRVMGGIGVIQLDWNPATYSNHAYTQIWRNNVDVLGSAQLIGTTVGSVYSDPVPPDSQYYYWIRFVSNVDVAGPYNATSGTPARSSLDVEWLLNKLTSQISESHLYDALRQRINLIDADDSVVGSLAYRVKQQALKSQADITYVKSLLMNQNESFARDTSTLTASLNGAYAGIATERTARVTADSAFATQLNTVSATATNADARVTTLEQTKIGYATLNSAPTIVWDNNGTIVDKAGVDAWNTTYPNNKATWHVGLPVAQAVKQVAITDSKGSGSLETKMQAVRTTTDALELQYTVKLDNNGYIAGFGLANTGATTFSSEFYINADRFAVTRPANFAGAVAPTPTFTGYVWYDTVNKQNKEWNGTTWVLMDGTELVPFTVNSSPFTITLAEGSGTVTKTIPAGAYMNGAYILDGTISKFALGIGSITTAHITDGTITTAKIADATITVAKIEDIIKSTNYTPSGGTLGWQIEKSGNAVFNQAVVRGGVYASSGTIGGINMNASSLYSTGVTNYNTGTGFYLDNTGYFRVGNPGGNNLTWNRTSLTINGGGTFTGTLSAATGSFSGSVTATSGSIGGMTITSNSFYSGDVTGYFTGQGLYFDNTGYFRVGNPTGQYLAWNRSYLEVSGDIIATGNVKAENISEVRSSVITVSASSYTASVSVTGMPGHYIVVWASYKGSASATAIAGLSVSGGGVEVDQTVTVPTGGDGYNIVLMGRSSSTGSQTITATASGANGGRLTIVAIAHKR